MAPVTAPYRGRRVLIVGASGFIGRWVARAFSEAGAEVILAVRDPAMMRGLMEPYGIRGRIAACDLECGDGADVVRRERPAMVVNCAGYGVDREERDAAKAERINAGAVLDLATALVELRDPTWVGLEFLHLGSALEYGTAAGDLREDTVPQPTTVYGRTKLAGTTALGDVCRATGLRGITARLFTAYGPGEHAGRLLPALLDAARRGSAVPLSEGTQRRDFTFVGDVAEGVLRLGLTDAPPGEVVNLATGVLHSVREFALVAAHILRLDPSLLHFGALPTRQDEMQHDPVAVDRLRRWTGWAPGTSIRDGIMRSHRFVAATPMGSIGPRT